MKVREEVRETIRKAVNEGVSLREIGEMILQEAMMEEREAYLEVEDDEKNGTYFRYLGTGNGVLRLRVPRTRKVDSGRRSSPRSTRGWTRATRSSSWDLSFLG